MKAQSEDRSRRLANATLFARAAVREAGAETVIRRYTIVPHVLRGSFETASHFLSQCAKPVRCLGVADADELTLTCEAVTDQGELDFLQHQQRMTLMFLRRQAASFARPLETMGVLLRAGEESTMLTALDYASWLGAYRLPGINRMLTHADEDAKIAGASMVVLMEVPSPDSRVIVLTRELPQKS